MTKFEKLINSNPKGALKQIESFLKMPFWEHWSEYMRFSREILKNKLTVCDLKEVRDIRAQIQASRIISEYPEHLRDILLDNIALEKDAKKVEEARKS